jgi:hypothetical protein
MQTRTGAKESSAHSSQPFFSERSGIARAFFAPMVQAKCASCEHEDKLQRQAEQDEDTEGLEMPAVQRKCAACEADAKILPKLEIGRVDDPLETEADVMADRVVRRQPAEVGDREREAMPLQAKAQDSASASPEVTSPDLETSIADASGSGAPLAPHTRDQMEDAFGADFSGVRVHTGAASAAMNDEIGARAFTYGTDIHFNNGEFSPGTEGGARLLAHELTHVVQQNGGVRRTPKRIQPKAQLGPLVFGPATGMPKGNLIHNEGLLPSFKATGLNPGLWVEPRVPGANRKEVGRGLHGEPDFYRDNAFDGRPIGINEGKLGGFSKIGVAVAAPQPPATPGGPVQEMAHAPKDIELGDVKPGQSGEEQVGRDQITNYSKGIKNTAKAVNDYQAANSHTERWDPEPGPMKSLTVPDKLAKSSTGGVRYGTLSVWEWIGKWKRWSETSMKGSCIVYKSSVNGVWAYEWMPEKVPDTVGDDPKLKKLLERLEADVKPKLHSDKKAAPKLQDSSARAPQRPMRKAARRLLQRKSQPKPHEKFDEKAWLGAYNPWHADAEKTLGDAKTKENIGVLDALSDAKKRTRVDPGIPESVKERAKTAATVRHWVRYGKLYGWFRKTFDTVYVKLAGFAQKVKAKVKGLARSAGSSGFGNWIKAAALALFKVAKKLGAMAVSMIVDKLLDSLQEGVMNAVKKLADEATPENVKSKIEEVEALKAKYELMLQQTQDKLEERLFGDKLAMFSKLDKYMEIANAFSTVVSLVRWGIRLVACASPPLLGCLWNLAIAALEYAFSKIMETCWFSEKVFGWIRDTGVTAILNFPADVAKIIAEKGNELLPLPEGIGPVFAEIKVTHKDFDIKCGAGDDDDSGGYGGGPEPTEEQKALMALAKEVGDAKLEVFLEMAAKRAADYNVALDAERIKKLGPLINSLTIEQMKQLAANQPTEGVPVPVEEFLKSIATLAQAESERKAARKIDYDKAQRSNPKFEHNQIGWKPELFVASGKEGEIGPSRNPVASDSKEFADAIYDIQKLLGLEADGMAGPNTTKKYYERNNVPKDQAYERAVELVEEEKRAIAEQKAIAERKKEIDALLKDEKVKAALDTPFPPEDQLKKDLASLHWENLGEGGTAFVKEGGRAIIAIKTDLGHRIGAYFRFVEREDKGVKKTMMLDTSRFYALDAIDQNEIVSYSIVDNEGRSGLWFMALLGQKKDSFSAATLQFFSLSVEFE